MNTHAPWAEGEEKLVEATRAIALAGSEPQARLSELAAQARILGSWVQAGYLHGSEVTDALYSAGELNGLVTVYGEDEIQQIIADGFDDPAPLVNGHRMKPVQTTPLRFMDLSGLDGEPIPERQWAIRDRVPLQSSRTVLRRRRHRQKHHRVTKNVAHMVGKDWFGSMPEPVRRSTSAPRTTRTKSISGLRQSLSTTE